MEISVVKLQPRRWKWTSCHESTMQCACVFMYMGEWVCMCGATACSHTLQLYSVRPLAKLVNRQTWVAPEPRVVRKCTAFSGGGAVAVNLSSYWYTPSSLAERVNLATVAPNFRGRYSKVHEPCGRWKERVPRCNNTQYHLTPPATTPSGKALW